MQADQCGRGEETLVGLFSKKGQAQRGYVEPPIVIGSADLADAAALMERFDRSLGNSDAIWATLEGVARRGGFVSAERLAYGPISQGVDMAVAFDLPWRWWATASTVALSNRDNILPSRIFLFTKLFTTTLVPKMNLAARIDLGLGKPADGTYRIIASNGAKALAVLPPGFLIHDTATGKLDVAHALAMAKEDIGI
jgi:hypothetical protein